MWVNGEKIPTLTNLEYRLLLLLYGRIGKIVTKYEVVEAVWGEDYIDDVDDARIEKLVSRLRQKIEPDPANPKHLHTVRGRGYKLADGSKRRVQSSCQNPVRRGSCATRPAELS